MRTVLRSSDVEELTAAGTALFSPHRLRYRGESALLSATPLDRAQLIRLQYHGDSVVETTEELGYYAVHLPVRGRSAVRFGPESLSPAAGGGIVFNPSDQPSMRWSADLCQLAIRVSASQVRAQVAVLTGRPAERRLRFEHHAMAGVGWTHTLRMIAAVADQHQARALPGPMARSLLDMFLTALVMSQPSNCAEVLLAEPRPPAATAIERVLGLVAAAPEEPWSLARLAAESGLSARSLQKGFQAHQGCSPMEFVRARRLELAHHRLVDPALATMSVAQIATDSGFSHLGRFAQDYRRRYGVTPSGAHQAACG